jgi:hypothetical protein
LRALAIKLAVALAALLVQTVLAAPADAALTEANLVTYRRVGRFGPPVQTPIPPDNSLLASEASGVANDWDTDSLFVLGDGGTSGRPGQARPPP